MDNEDAVRALLSVLTSSRRGTHTDGIKLLWSISGLALVPKFAKQVRIIKGVGSGHLLLSGLPRIALRSSGVESIRKRGVLWAWIKDLKGLYYIASWT